MAETLKYREGACCRVFVGCAKIYTLSDLKGNVFYVGSTSHSLEKRLSAHLAEARLNKRCGNKKKNEKIRSLNFQIEAKVIDIKYVAGSKQAAARGKSNDLEGEWIKKYVELGYDLCNKIRMTYNFVTACQKPFIGQTIITKAVGNKIEISEVSPELKR